MPFCMVITTSHSLVHYTLLIVSYSILYGNYNVKISTQANCPIVSYAYFKGNYNAPQLGMQHPNIVSYTYIKGNYKNYKAENIIDKSVSYGVFNADYNQKTLLLTVIKMYLMPILRVITNTLDCLHHDSLFMIPISIMGLQHECSYAATSIVISHTIFAW